MGRKAKKTWRPEDFSSDWVDQTYARHTPPPPVVSDVAADEQRPRVPANVWQAAKAFAETRVAEAQPAIIPEAASSSNVGAHRPSSTEAASKADDEARGVAYAYWASLTDCGLAKPASFEPAAYTYIIAGRPVQVLCFAKFPLTLFQRRSVKHFLSFFGHVIEIKRWSLALQVMVLSYEDAPMESRMPYFGSRCHPLRPLIFLGKAAKRHQGVDNQPTVFMWFTERSLNNNCFSTTLLQGVDLGLP